MEAYDIVITIVVLALTAWLVYLTVTLNGAQDSSDVQEAIEKEMDKRLNVRFYTGRKRDRRPGDPGYSYFYEYYPEFNTPIDETVDVPLTPDLIKKILEACNLKFEYTPLEHKDASWDIVSTKKRGK